MAFLNKSDFVIKLKLKENVADVSLICIVIFSQLDPDR